MTTQDKDTFEIFVNGRARDVNSDELTYEEVVNLAFDPLPSGPNISITVSFRNGAGRPPEGTLRPGQSAKIQDGPVFDATATTRS